VADHPQAAWIAPREIFARRLSSRRIPWKLEQLAVPFSGKRDNSHHRDREVTPCPNSPPLVTAHKILLPPGFENEKEKFPFESLVPDPTVLTPLEFAKKIVRVAQLTLRPAPTTVPENVAAVAAAGPNWESRTSAAIACFKSRSSLVHRKENLIHAAQS
jgi:hypothetical protein